MALNVPKPYQHGFRDLADLSDDQFAALTISLTALEVTLFSSSTDLLSSPVPDIDEQVVQRIVDSFISLELGAMDLIESTPTDVASSVSSQISDGNGQLLSDHVRAKLRGRVETIIQIKPLRMSIRALSLQLANGRNFISGRIVTDLRPVFESSKSYDFGTLLVLHRLQIHCTAADGKHEEIIFTLDSSDLASLTAQLNRAVEKEMALKKTLENSKLNFLTAFAREKV